MLKTVFGLVFGVLAAVGCFGARQPGPVLCFDHTRHDFGTIAEKEGVVSHKFRFTNISDRPLVIEEVLTTCGCTVADFDRRPILPGEGGTITVRFDPRGRTSTFHKSVRVVSGGGKSVTSLFLSGTILLEETSAGNSYEIADDVFIDRLALSFGVLHHGGERTARTLTIRNARGRAVRLDSVVEDASGCLRIVMPEHLAAGATATVSVSAVDVPAYYGSLRDRIVLSVDGVAASHPVSVFGYLVDDMRGVRLAEAPRCAVERGYFNFGTVLRGSRCGHTFTLRNEGRSSLIIRKIEASVPVCVDFERERTLSPGEELTVGISVDTRRPAVVDADIRVISNDTRMPVLRLKVEGEIK